MPWWDNALYDTCSLITLDKLLLDHPELAHYFRHVVALEASFSADQLREATAQRMRQTSPGFWQQQGSHGPLRMSTGSCMRQRSTRG